MKKSFRRVISLFLLLTFLLQPFAPVIVAAEEAANQKAQIEKAVADYQKTYDEIMSIEPIELGKISKWVLNRINDIKNFFSRPPWQKESAEEKKAREEKEQLERYVPKIEKANKDIEKIQQDAKKTMELLKSGKFQAAAKTDPSKVYNSIDENATALGIYQKALQDASSALLDAAGALSTATTILGSVSLLCTAISAGFPPAAPFTGPIAAITGKAASATGIAASILKAAGNTLGEAAEKAITGDKEFLAVAGKEATKAAAEQAVSRITGKAVSSFAGDYAKAVVDDENTQELVKILVKKTVGDSLKPGKSAINEVIGNAIDRVPDDIIDRTENAIEDIELPAARTSPGLGGGSW